MRLAFYIGRFGRPFDWLICAATRSRYSHVELVTDSGDWISASPRDGGVRKRNLFRGGKFKREHWEFLDISCLVSVNDKARVEKFLLSQIGANYDYIGATSAGFKIQVEDRGKWFCSELIYYAFQLVDILPFGSSNVKTPKQLKKEISRRLITIGE